jgi:DNA transposition AAA+ family ATPase
MTNTPRNIEDQIEQTRRALSAIAQGPLRRQAGYALDTIRLRDERYQRENKDKPGYEAFAVPPLEPTWREVRNQYNARMDEIGDPTSLIILDEADRLRMASLEQVRAIFDQNKCGVVLIGMPGIEKRMARYPQFYSRIGFVHEFRPLGTGDMRWLFAQRWAPSGVKLPDAPWSEGATAAVMRITGGNFRLLNRLLTQIERILEINELTVISQEVVEAARESLVIGRS